MKQKVPQLIGYIILTLIIIVTLLHVMDFHRDGITLRDGNYSVTIKDGSRRLDIYGGAKEPGTNVWFWQNPLGAGQYYAIHYIGDGAYTIMYEPNSACIGVAEDGSNVEEQVYSGADFQKWKITRIGNTQFFQLQNVASGLSMHSKWKDNYLNCEVASFDESDSSFYLQITK